jgi:hypothetical protein
MLVGMRPSETGTAFGWSDGGIDGGTVGSSPAAMVGSPPIGPNGGTPPPGVDGNPPIGPDGIPDIGPPSWAARGAGVGPGRAIGPAYAGADAADGVNALPQLRQYFMPGGFSPRHSAQTEIPGNPDGTAGVCARELPQFRQNDDPPGLSWPHIEQRIVPLTLNPIQVSQQPQVSGMGAGWFATP